MIATPTLQVLERLESMYGEQVPNWPTDPYQFLIWWQCGYPASDARCAAGWASLTHCFGTDPKEILAAPTVELARALKPGGMVPELRAQRIREIADRVMRDHGGELRLTGSVEQIRKALKSFPGIADPGADRILLFAGLAPVAAVPSNCPQVLVRIQRGLERENYGLTYREAQEAIEADVPRSCPSRSRAYLLLKAHGEAICKRTHPKCEACALRPNCAYYAGRDRGRAISPQPARRHPPSG